MSDPCLPCGNPLCDHIATHFVNKGNAYQPKYKALCSTCLEVIRQWEDVIGPLEIGTYKDLQTALITEVNGWINLLGLPGKADSDKVVEQVLLSVYHEDIHIADIDINSETGEFWVMGAEGIILGKPYRQAAEAVKAVILLVTDYYMNALKAGGKTP